MSLAKLGGRIAYGGDYNPEQWTEDVWRTDVRLMRDAGVNLATVGVFAWSHLEPGPGRFELAWLDRVLDLMHDGGIAVDLATATASPPPWLTHRHPEVLPVLPDGVLLGPGSRQHFCPSSPLYRAAARRLVEVLAGRYASHPALALWHVGNEYACHVPACWCDTSAAAFRSWLARRYGTVDALNEAWGTAVWSQRYSGWEEVLPPRWAPHTLNPTQLLDYHRFSSDALLECFQSERAVLRELSPGVPVTTNLLGFLKPLDYWRWAGSLDVVGNDSYPDPADPASAVQAAAAFDLVRSLGGGRPWLLMEQSPNRVSWRRRNAAMAPGQMRLRSYQAVARGSDGVMFFQWRQPRAGAEKFHSAAVPHGPVETSPTWRAVVHLGEELGRLRAVADSRVRAEVAIVFDWDSWWALELSGQPSGDLRLLEQVQTYYRPLHQANVTADFVPPEGDLSRYRMVLVPNLYLVTDAAASSLRRFVEGGGTMVMSFFSGIVDPSDQVRLGGYPGPFRDVVGLRVEDFLPLGAGERVSLHFADARAGEGEGELWSELVWAEGAELVAVYGSGPLAGHPAITRNVLGGGAAYYLSTRPDTATMARLLRRACAEAGVAPAAEVPAGVEAVRRRSDTAELLFLLNHGADAVEVPLGGGGVDLITGRETGDRLVLPPEGVAIVQDPAPDPS